MKHFFSLMELVHTDTKLPNVIESETQFNNILNLRIVLNVVRAFLGAPIKVNSGYRSVEVNKKVGGVDNSYHRFGRAADITCSIEHFPKLFELCEQLYEQGIFVECILYPDKNFIHVAI